MEKVKYRKDYLDSAEVLKEKTKINNKEPFLFILLDIMQVTVFKDKGRMINEFAMIGNNLAGERVYILLKGIPIYTYVLRDSHKTKDIITDACFILNINNFYIEEEEMLPGNEFSLKPYVYYKIFFDLIKDRLNFIKHCDKSNITTAFCDTKFEIFLSRFIDFDSCGWNYVQNYNFLKTKVADTNKIPFQIEISYKNIKRVKEVIQQDSFIYDKAIVCAWDLETYSDSKFGEVPQPKNGEIKMCSLVFRYYHSNKALEKILISSCVFPRTEGILSIISNNIPKTMSEVLNRMQPDFIIGFNDGNYDWPFIKEKITNEEEFKKNICALNSDFSKDYTKNICSPLEVDRFPKAPIIKIDAQTTSIYKGYISFGSIIFDMQFIMRKKDIKETKFHSLNSFLERYGLDMKKDMPYDEMDRIFHIESLLREKFKLTTHFAMVNFLKEKGEEKVLLEFNEMDKIGNLSVTQMPASKLLYHINKMSDVGVYCIYDAEACINLLKKINLIPDVRLLCSSSFTYFKMGIFNADGIKVRNLILYEAMKPIWGVGEKKYPLAFKVYKKFIAKSSFSKKEEKTKFPGGYVFDSIIGLYKRTVFEKRKRRRNFSGSSDPQDKDFNILLLVNDKSLINLYEIVVKREPYFNGENFSIDMEEFFEKKDFFEKEVKEYFRYLDVLSEDSYKNFCENFDNTDCFDRALTGVDFSSLYPSIIMAYNFSPEMYISPERVHNFANNFVLTEINTIYKKESEVLKQEHHKKGFFVKHTYNGTEIINHGIFPTILKDLFAKRKVIKKEMNKWVLMLEKLNKEFPKELCQNLFNEKSSLKEIIEFFDEKIKSFGKDLKNYKNKD